MKKTTKITKTYTWYRDDVRNFCIRHNYYTAGDCRAYEKMLNMVENEPYSDGLLYKVAKDILEHSEDTENYVENMMFCLFRETVSTFFKVIDEFRD